MSAWIKQHRRILASLMALCLMLTGPYAAYAVSTSVGLHDMANCMHATDTPVADCMHDVSKQSCCDDDTACADQCRDGTCHSSVAVISAPSSLLFLNVHPYDDIVSSRYSGIVGTLEPEPPR